MVGSPEFLLVALTESQEEATGLRPTVKKRKESRQTAVCLPKEGTGMGRLHPTTATTQR